MTTTPRVRAPSAMRLCALCGVLWAAAPASGIAATAAPAIGYPARPVRLIIGQAPGGGLDIISRALAQKLTETLGQSVVVDNRAGASGTIGSALAAKATPDGYTALIVSVTFSINPSLYSKLPFHPVKDFQPVSLIASAPFILLVSPSVPVKTVKELIDFARARPKHLNYGSGGRGNSGHLAAELFCSMAGVEFVHVPYKGTGLAMNDLLSGQLQMIFNSMIQGLPYAKSGRLMALAVTAAKRSPAIPELPTIAESGLPGYDFSSWYGLMVPAGTPREIVNKLNTEVVQALKQPDFRGRLARDGSEPIGSTPEQFAAHLASEMAKWEKVVKSSGMRIE
jgi:tripartite-type tricarboxylate transporter receptor subunit TctC